MRCLALVLLLCAVAPCLAGEPVRLVCIGDSISQGRAGRGPQTPATYSYRYPLWKYFVDHDVNVQFVGSMRSGFNGSPDYAPYEGKTFPNIHECHWGWTAGLLLEKLPQFMKGYTADIAIIQLGSNSTQELKEKKQTDEQFVEQTLREFTEIIRLLREKNPNVIVIVCEITQPWVPFSITNSRLPDYVKSQSTEKSPVHLAYLVKDWINDPQVAGHCGVDWVHPNEKGDKIMADEFWRILKPILLKPGPDAGSGAAPDAGYAIPDVLLDKDGRKITTREEWEKNRARVLDIMLTEVYGKAPPKPAPGDISFHVAEKDEKALDGAATFKRVNIGIRKDGVTANRAIPLLLFTPNNIKGPVPTYLLITGGSLWRNVNQGGKDESWPAEDTIKRGYGIALYCVDGAELIQGLFDQDAQPRADSWGTIAGWGWCASRCLDYFETDPDVDAARVAVLGHSRYGKTALYAAATDTRFALTISNCSGCGGAALSKRCKGETVIKVNRFEGWFCPNFKKYNDNEEAMDFDQHFLIATIAPRAVYVASATKDGWSDPYGEFRSLVEAEGVFKLYGLGGIGTEWPKPDEPRHARGMAYHVRTGDHDLTLWDWQRYMDFGDKVLRAGSAKATGQENPGAARNPGDRAP